MNAASATNIKFERGYQAGSGWPLNGVCGGEHFTLITFLVCVCLETRTSGSKEVWMLLRNACEADPETAHALTQAAQLQLPQDSLTTAID